MSSSKKKKKKLWIEVQKKKKRIRYWANVECSWESVYFVCWFYFHPSNFTWSILFFFPSFLCFFFFCYLSSGWFAYFHVGREGNFAFGQSFMLQMGGGPFSSPNLALRKIGATNVVTLFVGALFVGVLLFKSYSIVSAKQITAPLKSFVNCPRYQKIL